MASQVNLKLLIDKKARKVVFAEAGKDLVDFLFNLLSLPVGTVIKLLSKQSMVGCLRNLYDSVEKLNETYMQPNQNKDLLLNPKAPIISSPDIPLLLPNDVSAAKKFYMCPSYHRNFTDDPNAVCPHCNHHMRHEVPYVSRAVSKERSGGDKGGFVKGVVTYMVMDDLVVMPMSTISSITLLTKFNVKEVGSLEERVIDMGINEGLKLLKASLESKTVLTCVFLGD